MTIVLMFLTAIGVVLTTLQTILTAVFRRRRFFVRGRRFQPAVSILKPVCGLEDELEENLESFARLQGIDYEVLVSVADPNDPALTVVRRFPQFRVIVGGDPELETGNRKVARLIAAAKHARGDVLLISDANVRVEADDLARTLEMFHDPKVGCVSNLFTGAGARSFGATIESLHLLSFVVSGNVLASFAGVPCVVGKSMAISRAALDAAGGFERFARVLAEDQAIGLAVKEAGFEVVLSPTVVRNVVVRRTLRRALDRQIRWNKIRYAFSRGMYSAEFLLHPFAWAVLVAVCGGPALLFLLVAGLRMGQIAMLAVVTDARLLPRDVLLVPLLDLLQFGAQFVPYVDNRVTWRGYTARIGRNTELIEIAEAA
ncbi:MAG TPA: glycosyltransferase [Thermoanaerobaculia bacterium]|nr:glycosyltransferase [Thermoanaerobaculia bacterium]